MTLVDRLLNEVANYGGLALRRGDIHTLATEHLGAHAGEPFGAWYFALHGPALDGEPFDLETARDMMTS